MMWYPGKAAFRVGYVQDVLWNNEYIGPYSMAGGNNSYATGSASFAFGAGCGATNHWAAAFGYGNLASGDASFAGGSFCSAGGSYSLAFGLDAQTGDGGALAVGDAAKALGYASAALGFVDSAAGPHSFVAGEYSSARGTASTAMGSGAVSAGTASLAVNSGTFAGGDHSAAMGYGTVTRSLYSAALGYYTKARSVNALVIGRYNDSTVTNGLFEIGNGTADNARKNALTVLQSGNVGIGTINPAKPLEVVGPTSAQPVTVVVANRGGFGPAQLEFVSDYGLVNQWRPGYVRSNDAGSFTGSVEIYTNGTGSGNLYGSIKGFEVRNGVAYTATGTVSSFSDARLKHDVQPFTDGLDVIKRISPVSFLYNSDAPFPSPARQVGVIAQELQRAAPYMVESQEASGMKGLLSVNNQAYVFLLVNAVKELSLQVDELKQQNQEILKQLNSRQ